MIKNFLFILNRFKTSSILNILGLSVAFAVFIIIMMQVDYDYHFDTFHKNSDRIYRVELVQDDGKGAIFNRPVAELWFQSSPHIVAGALTEPWTDKMLVNIEKNGSKFTSTEDKQKVSSNFPQVFQFTMMEGSEKALEEPAGVVIPQSLSQKLFGKESALDKQIGENAIVKGVYKDFPANSLLKNCIYYPISKDENIKAWGTWQYVVYVRLDASEAAAGVRENMIQILRKSLSDDLGDEVKKISVQLTTLPDLHFTTDVQSDFTPKSSRQTLYILFSIAIAIIAIAAINFTNFSVALIPRRVRSINTQKVWGATTNRLRILLITEAIGISLTAYVLALIWIYMASQTPIAGLLDSGIHLFAHPGLLVVTAFIALITGVFSGLYPAFYTTSFQPAMALKGSFGLSPQGRKMRNLLIGVQFVVSFVLIMSAFFMYLQSNFLKKMPLGFNRDQIIITDLNQNIREKYDAFTNELKTFAGIEDVAYSLVVLTTQDTYMGWGVKYNGNDINFQCLPVAPSFLRVLGIKINDGRDFREDDKAGRHGKFIFNEEARKEYGLQLNTTIDSSEIVGFIPNVQFTTFHTTPTPMAFYVWGTEYNMNWKQYAYIKVAAGSDMSGAIRHVRNTLAKLDPDRTFNVRFFDEAIQNVYQKEQHLTLLITLFSAIAVLISVIGVFGLIIFDTAYRRKEISIRRVLGSSIMEVLTLFNRVYLILLGICFLIACPITYYAISRWLQNFACKTPMYWWVFLLGGVIVLLITLLTVSSQSYRAAVKNPTEALSME